MTYRNRLAVLVALTAMVRCSASPQFISPFQLKTQSDGWLIDYHSVPVGRFPIVIGGRRYLAFTEKTCWTPKDAGKPLLPVESISLAVPPGVNVRVELIGAEYDEAGGIDIAPGAPVDKDDGDPPAESLVPDPQTYATDALLPGREIWSDAPQNFRQLRIATIHVSAAQYNPVRHIMRTLVKGQIRVTLDNVPAGSVVSKGGGAEADPRCASLYRSLVANPDQARSWAISTLKRPTAAQDSSGDWFTPGHPYIRLPVADDGWYRLDSRAVAAAGGAPLLADLASAAVFRKGRQVPIVVRQDSSIEFYGERKRGDTTAIDFYTDTSAYWVTWGVGGAARFRNDSVTGTSIDSILSAPRLLHMESNTDYYEGTGDSEITKNATVPGEGWVWDYYYPGTSITYPFSIDFIDPSADSAEVRVRLFGTTIDQSSPTHRAWFWINDSLAGQITFPIRKEGLFHGKVPARWLTVGANRLRILSDPPQIGVNQFYLDWFEILYPRRLHAIADTVSFAAPAPHGPGTYALRVDGFSSSGIEVYDLSNRRNIVGGSVAGDPVNGFSISFVDTLSAERLYAVRSIAAAAPVMPSPAKAFGDLRSGGGGADYIIVTHRDFLVEAQQLAAHRNAVNGVRAAVIDVQDIYDQFNFGDMNADCIKDFLRTAYTNWISPAPAFLLFFGDASWDFHRYKSTTVNQDFVPGYGVPVGDNWFTCFDPASPSIPWMFTGRIPVQTRVDAQRVVSKLITYDAYRPDTWNKRYLFITGGATPQEQSTFNALSNASISSSIVPAPLGGDPLRVFKTSVDPINGDYTELVRSYVQEGLVFLSFLGHSGGRYWSVDIGKPSQLGNTNGRLPFVASVSCNVGAFAEPATTTLSEDFLLADNQGAIGVWASSSLGYPYIGTHLVNAFLDAMRVDTTRTLGELTTAARIQVLLGAPADYAVVASSNLNPLIGDPLTRMAIPTSPDLAVLPGDVSLLNQAPSVLDSSLTVRALISNFGLVPTDSVSVSVDDTFAGKKTQLLVGKKLPPVYLRDSVTVSWHGNSDIGLHTFAAAVDPQSSIPDVDRSNNMTAIDAYVYANLLAVVEPLSGVVVAPGAVRLRVSSPIGADSASMQVEFQLDTTSAFGSPASVSSGPVNPGAASTEWTTPVLPSGKVFYWRARTFTPSVNGAWIASSFSTSQDVPAPPVVRWRQSTPGHIATGALIHTAPADSGITIKTTPTTQLLARSVAYNASMVGDGLYSILRVGPVTYYAYWWNQGTGFIGCRVDAFTGEATYRSFDLPSKAAQADSMTAFINSTPSGYYMMFSVIFDGRTNVTPVLRTALKSLGSALIDSVWPGHTWCMIARKGNSGPGMVPLEHWDRTAVVADSMIVQNVYSLGSGSVSAVPLPMPQLWKSFSWKTGAVAGVTDVNATIYGYHTDGTKDSLAGISWQTGQADLSSLNAKNSDSTLVRFGMTAHLSSLDALMTPVLREWSADFEPPADLAVTQRALSAPKIRLAKGEAGSVSLNVYNIGYRTSHGPRVLLSMVGAGNALLPLASAGIDSIPVSGWRTLQIPFATDGLPQTFLIQASVVPRSDEKELIWENNTALYGFTVGPVGVSGADYGVTFFSDGIRILEGDYVAAAPVVRVVLTNAAEVAANPPTVDLYVDGMPVSQSSQALSGSSAPAPASANGEYSFHPVLSNGVHRLRVRLLRILSGAQWDSVSTTIDVNVLQESRILQLLNFPNPFATDTWFTFILTGNRPPDSGTLRVYTIAGRKIREIPIGPGELQIGFNRIRWDGRDEEGDDVANGYYLYSLTTSSDGAAVRSLGKMVRIR